MPLILFRDENPIALVVHATVRDILAALDGLGEPLAAPVAASEAVDFTRLRRVLVEALKSALQIPVLEKAAHILRRVGTAKILQVQVLVEIDVGRILRPRLRLFDIRLRFGAFPLVRLGINVIEGKASEGSRPLVAALAAVQDIDDRRHRLPAASALQVLPQVWVSVLRRLDLPHPYFGVRHRYVFLEPPGTAVSEANRRLHSLKGRRLILPEVHALPGDFFLQFFESHVVLDKAAIVRIAYLVRFRHAGGQKCQFIRHVHVLPEINNQAHQRALHGRKLRQDLRDIPLTIIDDGRARLGDDRIEMILFYCAQVRPSGDVRAHGDIIDMLDSLGFQPSEKPLRVVEIHQRRRRRHHGNGLPRRQILKKTVRVVHVIPRVMVAGRQASPAVDAVGIVHPHFSRAVGRDVRLIRHIHRAGIDAFVATGATILTGHNSIHKNLPPKRHIPMQPVSPESKISPKKNRQCRKNASASSSCRQNSRITENGQRIFVSFIIVSNCLFFSRINRLGNSRRALLGMHRIILNCFSYEMRKRKSQQQ